MNFLKVLSFSFLLLWTANTLFAFNFFSSGSDAFKFDGKSLFINTDRYKIEWQNGCAVAIKNKLVKEGDITGQNILVPSVLMNGIGSYYDADPAQIRNNHIGCLNILREKARFSSFHECNKNSAVSCEKTSKGIRLRYKGVRGDASAVLVQEFAIDEVTGDLIINQRCQSAKPGIYALGFSILNLKRDITFAVPYFEGQRIDPQDQVLTFAFGNFWQLGLVIGESVGKGTFYVFADDPELSYKYLRIMDDSDKKARALNFESVAYPPFKEKIYHQANTWRFNTFAGNWHEPASLYKSWLKKTYKLTPLKERSVTWPEKLALVSVSPLAKVELDKIAEFIGSKNILVHYFGWAKGFNQYCPYYKPKMKKFNNYADSLRDGGYNLGVYTSMKLIDVNAWPELFRRLKLKITSNYFNKKDVAKVNQLEHELMYGKLKLFLDKTSRKLLHIHPGNRSWLKLYTQIMKVLSESYSVNLLYQDVAGNSALNPLEEGQNINRAVIDSMEQIRSACPATASSAEYRTEISVAAGFDIATTDFGIWFNKKHHENLAWNAHPFMAYIVNDFTRYFNHRSPAGSSPQFHWDMNIAEITGIIPVHVGRFIAIKGRERLNLERAKLFSQGFRHIFPKDYEQDVVGYMKSSDGRIVKYIRKGRSTYCYLFDGSKKRLLYARVYGERSVAIGQPVYIDGWIAYNDDGPIGLDPGTWYCVFPGKPTFNAPIIKKLPKNACIKRCISIPGLSMVSLNQKVSGQLCWQATTGTIEEKAIVNKDSFITSSKPVAEVNEGEQYPIANWIKYYTHDGRFFESVDDFTIKESDVQGKRMPVLTIRPPTGGKGAEALLCQAFKLPKTRPYRMIFKYRKYACPGDGANIYVRVNGQVVWQKLHPHNLKGWQKVEISLEAYKGQTILVSIGTDIHSRVNSSGDIFYFADASFKQRFINNRKKDESK